MVAKHLLAAPEQAHYGYDICQALGLRGGVLYPLLERLHNAGWLVDRWEDPRECLGRPPRRYYLLTSAGVEAMTVIANGGKPPVAGQTFTAPGMS